MYTYQSRVRYSETNKEKQLSLGSIVNYFQDCSTFQSQDLGLGVEHLKQFSRAWLLTSWQIIIYRYPGLAEYIYASTWPHNFNRIYGSRNFTIVDSDNKVCAAANSLWVLVNTETGHPVRVTESDIGKYVLEPPFPMEYSSRKILIPQELKEQNPFQVVRSNIDTNQHVNNGQYIYMAEDYLPDGFVTGQMRAEYCHSATLGDTIYPRVCLNGNQCTVILASKTEKPYAVIEFIGKENQTKQEVL